MGRVNDEHAMKGKSRRAGVDVANSRQKQGRQELAVGNAVPELFDGHLGALVAGRALDQGDKRFDLGAKLHHLGSDLRIQ